MAKTLTSNNIPARSSLNDIAPEPSWLDGYSVKSLDAFIAANAGEISYGLEAGHMYTWLLKKVTMKNAFTAEDGTQKPARLVLTWQEVKTGFEDTSNVWLTAELLEGWLEKLYKRTNGRVSTGLPKGVNLNAKHALHWLSTNPIALAYDYVNGSDKPYITFKWISPDSDTHGKNEIPG